MPIRSSTKRSQDENIIAKSIIEDIIEETESDNWNKEKPQKNPAAVALGKLGGLKGGKARAEKLTAEERKAIAKKAIQARWSKLHQK